MANPDYGAEAVEIANEIEQICRGRPTVSVLMALAMILGALEAQAARPNLDNLMSLFAGLARQTFDEVRTNG